MKRELGWHGCDRLPLSVHGVLTNDFEIYYHPMVQLSTFDRFSELGCNTNFSDPSRVRGARHVSSVEPVDICSLELAAISERRVRHYASCSFNLLITT